MQKTGFHDFSNKVQEVTSSMSDDDKLEFYEELLETGSKEIDDNFLVHTFSIVNGFEHDCSFSEKYNPSDQHETIDAIVNSDVDDDPIDLSVLQKEADELEEDYTELTDEEIMQIGINPWTHEKVDFNYLQKRLDDFIRIFQERLQNDTLEITIAHNRENLTHFNFIKTIVAFYQEQTKDSNKPKVNGNTYPDLHIQWRLDDLNQGDEMPRLVSIEPNEDRAFDYWLIHDRTNGATHEIVIKPNELGEYDISELIEYISERVNNERFGW